MKATTFTAYGSACPVCQTFHIMSYAQPKLWVFFNQSINITVLCALGQRTYSTQDGTDTCKELERTQHAQYTKRPQGRPARHGL